MDRYERLLTERFGIERFHPWQREAIEALAGGSPGEARGRVLLVAPTGGGKSLCYQLPAAALPGTALVLSPLISLMEDQVRALEARGVPATFIASTLPREENGRRLAGVRRGDYKIVYAAPERLAFDGFLDAMASSSLSLLAVDEAHCIVQWGHDFRPDYLRIGAAIERLRPPRVIACTATATPDTRDEILRRLGFPAATTKVILRGFARPNLHLRVLEVDGPTEATKVVEDELRDALGGPKAPSGAGIVYAATRRGAEQLAQRLRDAGWDATPYHAGLSPEARAKASADFADRTISVVVATNAFGMGIDRPDVRAVIHAQLPSSIEAYYQEVGRAGRDGAPARGLLLLAGADILLRRRLCMAEESGSAGRDLGPPNPEAHHERAARAWRLFRELLRYVDAATCRHDFILRYFGDEAESLGGCGHCDVCLDVGARETADPAAAAADLDAVRRALAGVARAKGGAGMQAVAAMLAGLSSERVSKLGLDRLSTFGALSGRSLESVMAILRALLANGWIDLSDPEFPVPVITPLGYRIMMGEHVVRIRLPEPRRARAQKQKKQRQAAEAQAASQPASPGAPPAPKAALSERDRALFEALRAHRTALARERSVPPYVVASDRTLTEITALRPRSPEELLMAHGMGKARVASYGDGLLAVVKAHAPPGEGL